MDDLSSLFVVLTVVIFIILLAKFNNRYEKIERELGEIRKRMDDLFKAVAPQSLEGLPILKEEPSPEEEGLEDEELPEEIPNRIAAAVTDEEPVGVPIETVEAPSLGPVEEETIERPVIRKRKKINYEKFIGENLFGKIGILVFVIGVGLFVKYAIDKEWINETMRTVLGFLTGSALLAVAGRLHKKYRTFSSLLAGGGFALFYLTVAIAFHYYHLFSQTVAFLILVGVTVIMSIFSVLYDRRELAVTSLIGGFLAPFLVSTGSGNYMVLFTYLAILNLGMFGLSVYKKWGVLPLISFVFTYLIMVVYILTDYTSSVSGHLFIFATLFYFVFLLPVVSILRVESMKMSRALLAIVIANNFIYLLLGALFLWNMSLPFKAEGLLSLFIAIVNLILVIWLRKNQKDYRSLVYTMLGLVLTFVSITVPIQLDGHYITLFWASEMVLLLWLYVKSKIRVYEYAALVMVCFTFISFMLDVLHATQKYEITETIFLNSSFVTSLFMGLATGVFAFLMERYRHFFAAARLLQYNPWNAIMYIMSVIILYYTFMMEFSLHIEGAMGEGVMLLFTSGSILAVGYISGKRFPIKQYAVLYLISIGFNALIYILNVWEYLWHSMTAEPILLQWLAVACVIANIWFVARQYYAHIGQNVRLVIYLNVLATFLWLTMGRSFLWQVGIDDFSAGFSLLLSIAGFVQMGLGMRLHQKALRMISLVTFGVVLLKLTLCDLWSMAPIGKIIVFILLGLILLVLSFLYQKLKNVLFKNDENEIG